MCSIGEESYSSGTRPPLTDSPTFCVDPIGKIPALCSLSPSHPSSLILRNRDELALDMHKQRWHNQLCPRLPLRVHFPRPNRPARPRPRGDLQPIPRAPLHGRARCRLLPPHAHARRAWLCHRGAAAPPSRSGKWAAAARAGGCAHHGRVGLGPYAGSDSSQGRQFLEPGRCSAAWRHGPLSALGRERRAELCACRAGRAGYVLVRFLPFSLILLTDVCLWATAVVGRSVAGPLFLFFPFYWR